MGLGGMFKCDKYHLDDHVCPPCGQEHLNTHVCRPSTANNCPDRKVHQFKSSYDANVANVIAGLSVVFGSTDKNKMATLSAAVYGVTGTFQYVCGKKMINTIGTHTGFTRYAPVSLESNVFLDKSIFYINFA